MNVKVKSKRNKYGDIRRTIFCDGVRVAEQDVLLLNRGVTVNVDTMCSVTTYIVDMHKFVETRVMPFQESLSEFNKIVLDVRNGI